MLACNEYYMFLGDKYRDDDDDDAFLSMVMGAGIAGR